MIKRLTVSLTLSLHSELKMLAAWRDLNLSQIILVALREYVERHHDELPDRHRRL